MKFAFSTNAFRNHSILDSFESIASIGYSGVEIMCDKPHAFPPLQESQINSIKKNLSRLNLTISNLNGFMMCAIEDFHHPSWIENSQDYRKKRIEHTKNCLELAGKLGVKTVSTEPGGPKSNNDDLDLDLFEEGLLDVLPIAEKNNTVLLIEPEPGLLIENSNQYLKFLDRFDTDYLGLNFDIGHFFCVGEDPSLQLKNLREHVKHIHIEDISATRIHEHLIPGKGSINLKDVLHSIEDINYHGFVTVELYPYLNEPKKAAYTALNYLNSILKDD